MIELQELPPMPVGGGGIGGGIGPSVAPSVSYAVKSYLPYLVVTTVMPLLGLLYIWIRTIIAARRREYLGRPENTWYTVYLLAGLLPLIGGAAVLEKIVSDYVYGTTIPWRWISTDTDYIRYKQIAEFLANFYTIAGLVAGLSILLILLHKYYENWYLDLAVYLGNTAWFLYLTPKPLARFKYTTSYALSRGIQPGTSPFAQVSMMFREHFLAGFIMGAALALAAGVYYHRSRSRKE